DRPVIREADLIVKQFHLMKDDYLLFLGRLVPEKGLSCLIQAFRKVKTTKKLVIAGGASDTDTFAKELKYAAQG
ncbi:glycosyl transferase family 1, partial [Klebsiella oxytoca]